jgi:hypothetical protein
MFDNNSMERAKDALDDMKDEALEAIQEFEDDEGNLVDDKLMSLDGELVERFLDVEHALERLNDQGEKLRAYADSLRTLASV